MSCRVLVVEHSRGRSTQLAGVFDDALTLVDVTTPRGAVDLLRTEAADVLLVDVAAPLSELQRAVELIMAERPVPMLLVATAEHRQHSFPLLAAGALDVIDWPEHVTPAFLAHLRHQLLLLSKVRVVQHPRGHRRRSTSSRFTAVRPEYPLVAIAASLGGPRALAELLTDLPAGFGAPVVVCQHITPGFSGDLAQWLGVETGLRVHEAADGQRLVKGEVYVAPAHRHLVVLPTGLLRCEDSPPVGGFRPSCDVLLTSAAAAFRDRAIGVVLTGMGRDGAKGLLEVRGKGGHTIAQDEGSCAVFGMPREAIALGAAEAVLPLADIAERLAEWVS